jgi:uncharacterized protein
MNHFLGWGILLVVVMMSATPTFAILSDSSLKVFAVAPDGTALSATLKLELKPGDGEVWSSVSGPLVGTATQSTEKIAVKVAKNYFEGVEKYDYFFSIDSEASVVDGPSAGSAMALLTVSTLEGKVLPKEVGLTGTITNTGEIGPVGGVFEKAKEAAKNGIKLFLIPAGESRQVVKLPDGVQNLNLPEYALEEWGMKVVETGTLDEVLKYAFSDIGEIDISETTPLEIPTYIPEKIEAAKAAQPLGELNTKFIQQTRDAITRAQNSLNHTLLDDAGLIEVLSRSLSDSEKTVNEAELLTQNGYHYSAGNLAFWARVNAYFVEDVSESPELIDLESGMLRDWAETLNDRINVQQAVFDKTVPIEGVEWYIAAQQRLTWAQEQLQALESAPVIVVATEDAAHAQAVTRIQDYEFAKAWYESSQEFYNVALQQSTKGLKTQTPFAEYYSDFLKNAENGLTLIQDGAGEDAERRLNAALLDQAKERHLSAAMNAASALALINGILIENDGEKDIRETLETKITNLEEKLKQSPDKYGWVHLYLDHAKFYLNSANYFKGINQGTSAANSLSSGLSLVLLAENTYEVTKDVQKYYNELPESQFTSLNGIVNPIEGVDGSSPSGGSSSSGGTTIPISIGSDGTGSITVNTGGGPNGNAIPISWILGFVVIFLAVVLGATYLTRSRIERAPEGAAGFSPISSNRGVDNGKLFAVDELEARLFAAKQGLRHAQHQYSTGHLSKESFEEVSTHYTDQIQGTSKNLRKATADLRSQERNGKTVSMKNERAANQSNWPKKKSVKKVTKKK